MSTFFGKIRSGAGQVAFEAEKLRRVNSVQSIIKSLHGEIEQTFSRTGHVAFELYQTGRVNQPELQRVCEHMAMLQSQVVAREREIVSIQAEEFQEPQRTPRYGRLCPNGHGELPAGAKFCPVCGAQPLAAPEQPDGFGVCPKCGAEIIPGGRFCPGCGAPVQPPAIKPAPPAAARRCAFCGASLLPEAAFCPECGKSIIQAPPISQPAPAWTAPKPEPMPDIQPSPAVEPGMAEESEAADEHTTGPEEALEENVEPEDRHCPNCGAFILAEAVFCPECGQHTP